MSPPCSCRPSTEEVLLQHRYSAKLPSRYRDTEHLYESPYVIPSTYTNRCKIGSASGGKRCPSAISQQGKAAKCQMPWTQPRSHFHLPGCEPNLVIVATFASPSPSPTCAARSDRPFPWPSLASGKIACGLDSPSIMLVQHLATAPPSTTISRRRLFPG